MKASPYLTFNGQCEEAFRFYEECLGGKILYLMKYGESPMADQMPSGWGEKIIHATLELSGDLLAGVDLLPNDYRTPQGFFVNLNIQAAEKADRLFEKLSEEGTIHFPIQETFWALRFGTVVDRFEIPWMINCGKPD